MGLLFLLGAAALLLYNKQEDAMAGKAAEEQLSLLVDRIQVQKDQQTTTVPSDSVEATNADELLLLPPTEKKEEEIMESIEVQGNGYIGYLSFPTLEMDLPVMSDWSVQKLYTAPCHYYGTAKGGNLVIMAHNYNHHFGRLTELRAGDPVYFVNIFGEPFFYEVVLQEILPPDCIPELTEGTYDLTLFTCTYGGANRITVRLNEAPPPQ
ncbi:MAG: sortase [Oscillospiraceae bacterium]|nr:sortase [Oscillospiraceae bacterium]